MQRTQTQIRSDSASWFSTPKSPLPRSAPVYEGENIAFTLAVSDVPSIGSYDLEVTAYGAANTTSTSTYPDIGFNSGCFDVTKSDD